MIEQVWFNEFFEELTEEECQARAGQRALLMCAPREGFEYMKNQFRIRQAPLN